MLSRYTTKCKYTFKMIQIIAKLDEIPNHILNMNWLYHFNLQLKSLTYVISQKTYGQVFHSNKHKCVEKLLSFERWQELWWTPLYQNSFYMFIKMLNDVPKIYQNIPKKKYIFLIKATPPHSVLSPCALTFKIDAILLNG